MIPHLDGAVMTAQINKPDNKVSEEKKESPVIFKMLENGYAECRKVPAGETRPSTVFHPELRIGRSPVQTEWRDGIGLNMT